MTEYIQAWQCIGCGKIEAPQPCIGVCRDRKILMVGKSDHESALEELRCAREKAGATHGLLLRLAFSTPRDGQWEPSYRALQEQARALLGTPARTESQGSAVSHV